MEHRAQRLPLAPNACNISPRNSQTTRFRGRECTQCSMPGDSYVQPGGGSQHWHSRLHAFHSSRARKSKPKIILCRSPPSRRKPTLPLPRSRRPRSKSTPSFLASTDHGRSRCCPTAKFWSASVAERRSMRVGEERLASARLSDDERSLENVKVLLDGVNRRIVFAPDGTLFVTGADRFRFYEASYDGTDHEITDPDILRNFTGRVARINKDGSIPKDNPFLDQPTVLPETYSYGHRDPEGAAINPATGKLWVIEHGPLGGDKISIIKPGGNYGWPNVSYGRRYNGDLVAGKGLTQKEGVEQPVYFWYPDIAPCALIFYTGDMFPEWKGNVLVGGMGAKSLIRLVLDGDKVVAEERLLKDLNQRVREVQQAPDGSLFILLDDGRLIRLSRK